MIKEEVDLAKRLSDFKPVLDGPKSGIFAGWHKYPIYNTDYDKCRLIPYLFNGLLKCPIIHKPMEKINWEIAFTYKDNRCTFAHQKFGFRVYVDNTLDQAVADQLAAEIMAIINHEISGLGPILKKYAKKAIKSGEIIVNNKVQAIELAYRYFSKNTLIEPHKLDVPTEEAIREMGINRFLELNKQATMMSKAAEYNEEAAYFTFISLIEHITVLFYAFHYSSDLNVAEFARMPWSKKYEMVFPIEDEYFAEFLTRLRDISNYRRNPTAHGHVTSKYTQADFYFEPAFHKIPISLYDDEVLKQVHEAEVNIEMFDKFLIMLRENPATRNIMAVIDSGHSISFLPKDLQMHEIIKKFDDEDLKIYLDLLDRVQTDAWNMDW